MGWPVSIPRSRASTNPCKKLERDSAIDRATYLFNGRNVLRRDVTSNNPVLKRGILARVRVDLHRLQVSLNLTKLSGSTTLLLVHIVESAGAGDCLSEGDSWFTSDTADVVLSLHSLDVDIQMQFSHSRDDGLLRFGINMNTECRVLLLESVECSREIGRFVAFRSNREGDDGFGDKHGVLHWG